MNIFDLYGLIYDRGRRRVRANGGILDLNPAYFAMNFDVKIKAKIS